MRLRRVLSSTVVFLLHATHPYKLQRLISPRLISTRMSSSSSSSSLPMLSSKEARIRYTLDSYYPNPPVPLNSVNSFTFLVAVVLSAQTTDGKVNEATNVLFKHASTPEAMAALSPAFVETIIRQVGLAPKKSVYVVELSKKIVANFGGQVRRAFILSIAINSY